MNSENLTDLMPNPGWLLCRLVVAGGPVTLDGHGGAFVTLPDDLEARHRCEELIAEARSDEADPDHSCRYLVRENR